MLEAILAMVFEYLSPNHVDQDSHGCPASFGYNLHACLDHVGKSQAWLAHAAHIAPLPRQRIVTIPARALRAGPRARAGA